MDGIRRNHVVGDAQVNLHPCPYCGSAGVAVEETDIGGYVVACPCCGMCGPEGAFASDAVRGWQGLCAKMCRGCRRHLLMVVKDLRRKLDESLHEHTRGDA